MPMAGYAPFLILTIDMNSSASERIKKTISDDLKAFIHSMPLAMLIVHENIIIAVNDTASLTLEIPASGLLGKPIREIVWNKNRDRFLNMIDDGLVDPAVPFTTNEFFIRGDASVVQLSVNICTFPLFKRTRSIILTLMAPHMEQDGLRYLLESEERFRTLAESIPMAILIYQENRWIYANPAAERITGYTLFEMETLNFWDLVHPAFKKLLYEQGEKLKADRHDVVNYEFKIITRSGEERWVLLNGSSSFFSVKPIGMITIADISEIKEIQEMLNGRNNELTRKNMEIGAIRLALEDANKELMAANEEFEAMNDELVESHRELEESERRYRDIFDNLSVGIYQTSLEGDFITINNEMARILGYEFPRDAVSSGGNITNFYVDPDARNQLVEEVRRKGVAKDFKTQFRRKNGETIWACINAHYRNNHDGKGEYLEGYILDITAQKKFEEEVKNLEKQLIQSQKMEAIGRLAGGIAHDFNNLLTAIMGNSELTLKAAGSNPVIAENINDILITSRRAADLTRKLLAFSRKQVINISLIDINEFLVDIERMLRRIIGETISMKIQTGPDPSRVKADPSLIEQVIVNLVVNARDAMPDGGIITIISFNEHVSNSFTGNNEIIPPGEYVRIDVSDTGIGMEKETMEKIFEPFFSTKGDMGTGLGLSTVYGIVRQNEGYLTVESEKGKGTTISIFLPRSDAIQSREAQLQKNIANAESPNGGGTILVVEDEDYVRKLIVRTLSTKGYHVLEASNSGEAISLCDKNLHQIDLILSDIVLPDIPGPELIEIVRSRRPEIKVLYMSGYPKHKLPGNEVMEKDFNFIPKPFLPSDLLKLTREILLT